MSATTEKILRRLTSSIREGGRLPDVKVDGRFGANTEKKVNAVRAKFGMDATGKFTKTLLDECKEFKK